MAWTPLPEDIMPNEETTLSLLQLDPEEPPDKKGFITNADLDAMFNVVLSRLYYAEGRITALEERITQLEAP